MGIGRREFLIQFSGALAVLAKTESAVGILEDLYLNRRHGIAFRKPHEWEFRDIRDIGRTKQGMLLEFENFDSAAFAEYLANDTTHEAFVLAADMRSARLAPGAESADAQVAPGLGVYYEGASTTDWPYPDKPFSLEAYVERDLENFAAAYRDFRLLELPEATTVSECEAMQYTVQWRYVHRDLPNGVTMRERVLYIYQGPAIYSVRMFDYPALRPPLTYNFESFIPTIRIL